ncbi:hypothetical protein CYMTET_28073 [Cymbomonas tetramitiformis]|uniref:Uncharacterized protein n=1 Tax=Cymbomonas tetramitiformis TaxID=36881 RepID=A0AAE0FNI7_9CHLO|nr:hypothetical protein CYMTET_28073 [Cymbomonas tetramitiformis]
MRSVCAPAVPIVSAGRINAICLCPDCPESAGGWGCPESARCAGGARSPLAALEVPGVHALRWGCPESTRCAGVPGVYALRWGAWSPPQVLGVPGVRAALENVSTDEDTGCYIVLGTMSGDGEPLDAIVTRLPSKGFLYQAHFLPGARPMYTALDFSQLDAPMKLGIFAFAKEASAEQRWALPLRFPRVHGSLEETSVTCHGTPKNA